MRPLTIAAPAPAESSALAPKPLDEPPHCQDFAPGGEAIEIPFEAKHLEVRTSGRPGLAVEWDSGSLVIEPKRYSALLELRSGVLKAGDEERFSIRFHLLAPE